MTTQPFKFDYRPSPIRPYNYERLIPTRELTDTRIIKYALMGKYGPELQKKYSALAENRKNLVRLKQQGAKTFARILKEMEY